VVGVQINKIERQALVCRRKSLERLDPKARTGIWCELRHPVCEAREREVAGDHIPTEERFPRLVMCEVLAWLHPPMVLG